MTGVVGHSAVLVLGPVEFWSAGVRARLSRLERSLLAVLTVQAGTVVSADRIVDELWPADPPASSRNRVQALISGLRARRGVEASWITTRPPGYVLQAPSRAVDADEFQNRVRQGRAAAGRGDWFDAVRCLEDALQLWRGVPYDGVDCPAVLPEAARLAEQRNSAREDLIDARLAVGDVAALLPELAGLVAEEPYRERLRGQLMLALYRMGRQAEALAVYRAGAAALADEHGLSPGPELRELHLAILRDDAGLMSAIPGLSVASARPAPPGPVPPAQLPTATAAFIGRQAELAALDRIVGAPRHPGTSAIATVSGTPGVGKTTLAVHWAHRVRQDFPDGQLYMNLRGFGAADAAANPSEVLRDFLDALGVADERVPAGLAARSALFRSLVADRRILVMLDNARDSEQVRPLLPASPGCMALVTSRVPLSGLVAAEGAETLVLDLLPEADARDLLARRIGGDRTYAEPTAVDSLVASCARLPLALAIVGARVATRPGLSLATIVAELVDRSHRLDAITGEGPGADLRLVFSWSYERLSRPAAALFRLLGLHPGPDISVPATASLAGTTPDEASALLAELTRASLLTEHVEQRYLFHDLLRAYANDLILTADPPPVQLDAIQRMLDHYLHSAGQAEHVLDPSRDMVVLPDLHPGVAPEVMSGMAQAMTWFAIERPVLLAVIETAARQRYDQHTWQLTWILATFLDRRGYWLDWVTAGQKAVAAAQRLDNPYAQARSHRGLALAYIRLANYDVALAHYDLAFEQYGLLRDPDGQAHTHTGRARAFEDQGRYTEALQHAQFALDIYRGSGNLMGEGFALNMIGWYHALLGDHKQTLTNCNEALAIVIDLDDHQGQAATWDSLGYAHHHLGHHADAISCYQKALSIYQDLGDQPFEADVLIHLGDSHQAAGDPSAARRVWQSALAILEPLGHSDVGEVRRRLTPP